MTPDQLFALPSLATGTFPKYGYRYTVFVVTPALQDAGYEGIEVGTTMLYGYSEAHRMQTSIILAPGASYPGGYSVETTIKQAESMTDRSTEYHLSRKNFIGYRSA